MEKPASPLQTGALVQPVWIDTPSLEAAHSQNPHYVRLAICSFTGAMVLAADTLTKAAPHPVILHHYRTITPVEFLAVGLVLAGLALYRSKLLALAAGFLLGALCGNGGELLLHGYATDWIHVDRWLTNLADISVLVGLICIYIDFVHAYRRRKSAPQIRINPIVKITTASSALCGLVAGRLTSSVDIGLVVFMCIAVEAYVIVRLWRKSHIVTG